MTTPQQPPLCDVDRHQQLRQLTERARRHALGDHTTCRPGACPAIRSSTPTPR